MIHGGWTRLTLKLRASGSIYNRAVNSDGNTLDYLSKGFSALKEFLQHNPNSAIKESAFSKTFTVNFTFYFLCHVKQYLPIHK